MARPIAHMAGPHDAARSALPWGPLALCVALLLPACATLVPLVQTEPEPPAPTPTTPPALSVEAMEGRPNGMLLRLRIAPGLPDGTRLSLWRLRSPDDPDGAPLLEQTLEADGQRRAALEGEGLGVLDAQPGADGELIYYTLRAASPAQQAMISSPPLALRWHDPAPAPGALRAMADLPGVVELRWAHAPGCQTLIFRRELDSDDPRPARIAQLPEPHGGTFIDRDIHPGAVYAYRLACVLTPPGEPSFFGRATGELFVAAFAPPEPEPEPETLTEPPAEP
jgi:hypothetical protein